MKALICGNIHLLENIEGKEFDADLVLNWPHLTGYCMDTIKQFIRAYLPVITVALLMLLVVVAGLFAYNMMHTKKLQEPVIINQTVAKTQLN